MLGLPEAGKEKPDPGLAATLAWISLHMLVISSFYTFFGPRIPSAMSVIVLVRGYNK